jgi:hypothetical protein
MSTGELSSTAMSGEPASAISESAAEEPFQEAEASPEDETVFRDPAADSDIADAGSPDMAVEESSPVDIPALVASAAAAAAAASTAATAAAAAADAAASVAAELAKLA